MSTYYGVARKDGRVGIRPFGSYNWKAWGSTVKFGDKKYKVTTDGRVYIPKHLVSKFGVKRKGRCVIGVTFASKKGSLGLELSAVILSPRKLPMGIKLKTGRIMKQSEKPDALDRASRLVPSDVNEYSWSP